MRKRKTQLLKAIAFAAMLLLHVMLESAVFAQTVDETPSLHAYIDLDPQGYVVYGETANLPSDTCRIQNLYSLDGNDYKVYQREWNMPGSVTSGSAIRTKQICLQSNNEPLCSYLSGALDRFYIKLLITRKNGVTCESNAVLIERNSDPQPIPDTLTLGASFSPSMCVRGPSGFYGRYQITVPDTATAEEIAAALPDTLPVRVQIGNGLCDIDCPVTWNPLALPALAAGGSVTIADAVRPVEVPAGTLLDTPLGVYRLDEPLPITIDRWNTGEVQLVLNVVSAGDAPSGGLAIDMGTLKMVFDKKPTGATSIRAYTLAKGEAAWTEIQGLSLLAAVNAQPSTANSGYAAILTKDVEPYRSFLAAQAAGDTPVPFLVGLKVEGGVYDGQQLVLAWPGDYELPPNLPAVGSGSGGNEDNAGSDNRNDSTDEGQRPNLPQTPDSGQTDGTDNGPQTGGTDNGPQTGGDDGQTDSTGNEQRPNLPQTPDSGQTDSTDDGPQTDDDNGQTDGGPQTGSDTDRTDNTPNRPQTGGLPQTENGKAPAEAVESGQQADGSNRADEDGRSAGSFLQTDESPAGNESESLTDGTPPLPKSPLHPSAAGFAARDEALCMEKPVGDNAALFVMAGAAATGICVAGVCAAASGKVSVFRLLSNLIKKIRTGGTPS